ncbi:MAG: lamin tail domain-containing protein [Prolixibacteraceae bacterium]
MQVNFTKLCFIFLFAVISSLCIPLTVLGDVTINTAPKPEISVVRGFYQTPFDATISSSIQEMKIYYTLDGSDPRTSATAKTAKSPVTVRIDPKSNVMRGKTPAVVLRAAAIKANYEFSFVSTRTYIFVGRVKEQTEYPGHDWPKGNYVNDQEIDLLMDTDVVTDPRYSDLMDDALLEIPTFSIVTDNANLFDPEKGIYVNAWGNRGEEWERPASIELIYPDGTKGFQIDAGLRIRGGWSRHGYFRKHAFRLFFSSKYGESNLNYPLFGDEGADQFDKIDLRCSQNYSWSKGENEAPYCTLNRDVFSRDLQHEMGQEYTRSRYYHLYVNGLYWGLFQTQERSESSFAASYFGGSSSDYDVIKHSGGESGIEVNDGSIDAWKEVWELCEKGFAGNATYYQLQGLDASGTRDPKLKVLVDIDNLIDYMNVIFYTGNFDGPYSSFSNDANNFYAIYKHNGEKGFQFFAHDNEHTLLMDPINVSVGLQEDRVNFGSDKSSKRKMNVTAIENFQPQWLHFKLSKNEEYRNRFADRAYQLYYNNGLLSPEKTAQLFINRTMEYDTAVIAESARWGDVDGGKPYTKDDSWTPIVQRTMNEYFPFRTNIVIDQLKSAGLLSTLDGPEFRMNNELVEDEVIQLFAGNAITLRNGNGSGSIKYTVDGSDPRKVGGSVAQTAVDGANLTNMSILQNTTINARIFYKGAWSALHTLRIEVSKIAVGLQITEIHYNPLNGNNLSGNEYEFLELKNSGNNPINLTASSFKGITFTFNVEKMIQPGEFLVLASSSYAFNMRYGFEPYGEYEGQLANGGERISLLGAAGDTIVTVKYNDKSPWPTVADGLGFSIVPAHNELDTDWDKADNWRPSADVNGSPGKDDVPLEMKKIFINEILANSAYPLVDAIELYNPNDTEMDISYWYLSDDNNEPKKYQIPSGTLLPANGYLAFYEGHYVGLNLDTLSNPAEFGAAFSLSSHGDDVYLFSANATNDLTGYDHHYDFPDSDEGVSFGRHQISTGKQHFVALDKVTMGNANAAPKVGPVVMNQVMYHPLDGEFEYLELINTSGKTINLYEEGSGIPWKISGISFDFPTNFSLIAGESVYLIEDALNPADFRFTHNLDPAVSIYNYEGQLNNGGEEITLYKPAPQYVKGDTIKSPYITVDRVNYNDNSVWPDADGNGFVLHRTEFNAYGNDPASWEAMLPAVTINNYPLFNAVAGVLYQYQLKVSGGASSNVWAITSGVLPSGLSLNASSGWIVGTPNAVGEFSFTVEVSDQSGSSDELEFSLVVTENTVPVALNDSLATTMNIAATSNILDNDLDDDGDLFNCLFSIAVDPKKGTAQINADGSITYFPDSGFVGEDSLIYRITDVNGFSEATLFINVGHEHVIGAFETRITASSDDASERLDNGKMNLTSVRLDISYNITDNGWQLIGLRFPNIAIPKGTEIASAYIQFTTEMPFDYESMIYIGAEDVDDAATYTTDAMNIRNRSYYQGAYAEWVPEIWALEGESGEKQRTPDLAAVVQYLVSRDGWQENNAIAFVLQPADAGALRIAHSFDGNPAAAPLLHIEYVVTEGPVLEPLALAGADQNVELNALVALNGEQSYSLDGRLLNYHWSIIASPDGSSAELNNPYAMDPAFTADQFGEYQLTLVVDNGHVQSVADTLRITVEDLQPIANAGPDLVRMLGANVKLNGSASYDPEMKQLTYEWTIVEKPEGSQLELINTTMVNPEFISDRVGLYRIALQVSDGRNLSLSDEVQIQVNKNQVPVAIVGDDFKVYTGAKVKLDGSQSYDPEEYSLTYKWVLLSQPAGGSAVLSDTLSQKPNFIAQVEGTYVVQLSVFDGINWSEVDEVVVTVASNSAPIANAGSDQNLTEIEFVYLDGSKSSDADGTELTFLWTFVTKPAGSIIPLIDANKAKATFAPDMKGLYTLRLMVSDGSVTSTDDVQIVVNSTTEVLSADLEPGIQVYPNPFNGQLNVRFNEKMNGTLSFELYTLSGALIARVEQNATTENRLVLNFENKGLKNGVYLLLVKSENQTSKMFRLMYKKEY